MSSITRRPPVSFKRSRVKLSIISVIVIISLLSTNFLLANVLASSISESYPTNDNFPSGTLVSILDTVPSTLELANINNSDYLAGVIETDGDSLLSFKKEMTDVQVATSGEVLAFVSDVNGDIASGDFVSTSWIAGVGMRARARAEAEQKMLGIALQDFSSESEGALEFEKINTPDGVKTAFVGRIAVKLFDREVGPDVDIDRSGLENIAARIAGKEVAFARVLAAAGLFVVSVLISGIFLANAIRGSFISLGRNPLASSSIYSSLLQVSGVSISLVLVGALTAYVVLII